MDVLNTLVTKLAPWIPASRTLQVLDAAALLSALYVAITIYRRRSRNPMGLPYPPGPKPSMLPLIGNIPDMPEEKG